MRCKFWIKYISGFDGNHENHTVQLMSGDFVILSEMGIQSSETGLPNKESLTESVLNMASRELTFLIGMSGQKKDSQK